MEKSHTFDLHAPFAPAGGQPEAIDRLIKARPDKSVLLGVTGSGKTFTMAHCIAAQNKPVLVLAPNKTLAAQLYEEFSLFFPNNKVCYFVSYYDYYQPESYLPSQDMYIPKETRVNSELERLRIEATASIINRNDTIVIASVSSIYSIGNPDEYRGLTRSLTVGQKITQAELAKMFQKLQYRRNERNKESGTFSLNETDTIVTLPYQKDRLSITIAEGVITGLTWVDKRSAAVTRVLDDALIFPAKHFVMTEGAKQRALRTIEDELYEHLPTMNNQFARERLEKRVLNDMLMIEELGYCTGVENYSRHFDGRSPGEAPYSLFDFFPKDFLLIIDESHIAIPQLRGMYAGDRMRKKSLVEHGFRLPSALDNRPLQFEEIENHFNDTIFVSATPGDYELRVANQVVEQVIRPTGLVDPVATIRKRDKQLDDLVKRIKATTKKGYRSLVMVLTKRLAEEVAEYLEAQQIKVCYLHSTLKTTQRTEILQKLRCGVFDCVVGVNLLREGIDLPEVAFVGIMDADLECFMRDKRSLIQIMGRAARNSDSKVVLYADKMTRSMRAALDELDRRRIIQIAHNEAHGITPTSVKRDVIKTILGRKPITVTVQAKNKKKWREKTREELLLLVVAMEKSMFEAADNADFDTAIKLRDELAELKNLLENS